MKNNVIVIILMIMLIILTFIVPYIIQKHNGIEFGCEKNEVLIFSYDHDTLCINYDN